MYTILRDYDIPTYYELETMLLEYGECCLVGTTGVGKTRISMGFVKNYKLNTLVISDRNAINKSWEKHAEESGVFTISTVTMQNFHKAYKMLINGFDLYIFDEAHHLGGNEWFTTYKKFKKLISEDCFIIGLTATSKRYFDKEGINDITETIFNGHAVYAMSRKEAINLGIIGEASYVYALYDATELAKKYLDKEMTDVLRGKLDWAVKNQPQVSDILCKYAPEGDKKGIIYVDRIKSIDDAVKLIGTTFPKEPIWYVHSKMRSAEIRRITEEFEKCKSGFMVNVDMISEGIHYDNINMIIMLRRTISPNKLVQQAGRASNSDKAIIFDLVGNRTSIKKTLARIKNPIERKKPVKDNKKENNHPVFEAVIVADYASDFLNVLDEIDRHVGRRDWTEEEDKYLKQNYPTKSLKEIAKHLGRTEGACRTRANELKIKRSVLWTVEEDEYLKQNYFSKSLKEIAKHLGRTEGACKARAINMLGLRRQNVWSEEEDKYLKQNYPTKSLKEIAKHLGRSRDECKHRVSELGLRKRNASWTEEEDKYLKQNYFSKSLKEIAKHLGRTEIACSARAKRALGLRKYRHLTKEEDEILNQFHKSKSSSVADEV